MNRLRKLFRQHGGRDCGGCQHFETNPHRIERMLPNLSVLGSAHASVAAGDGICVLHDTYQSDRFGCEHWMATARGPARGR